MIQHYFAVPYEDFTAKVITAMGVLKAVDNVPKKDIERVNWIINNTHKDILVSLWKLDRAVNPTKGDFRTVTNKRKFLRNDASDFDLNTGGGYISLDEDKIQHYLCEGIKEVHEIIVKNVKSYKEEIKIEDVFGKSSKKENGAEKFKFT